MSKKETLVKKYNELVEISKKGVSFDGRNLYLLKRKLSICDVPSKVLTKGLQLERLARDSMSKGDYYTALRYAFKYRIVNDGRNCDAELLLLEVYEKMHNYECATLCLNRIIEFCPCNPNAYISYAKLLLDIGNYQEAVKAVDNAIFYNDGVINISEASILIPSIIKSKDHTLLAEKMKKIKATFEIDDLVKFYKYTTLRLSEKETESFLPDAKTFLQYKEQAETSEEILNTEGIEAFTSYISHLTVPKESLALLYLNTASLCEKNKLGNLSDIYLTKAKRMEDGTLNIGKYVNETERKLKLLRCIKRGN